MELNISNQWFAPILGGLIKNRAESMALTAFAVGQVALTCSHITLWTCPIKAVLGIPCPGCGLSRACSLLVQGHWQASFQMHAFAPLLLASIGLIGVAAVLPEKQRLALAEAISSFERRTGLTAWVLLGLLIYWGFRLGGVV